MNTDTRPDPASDPTGDVLRDVWAANDAVDEPDLDCGPAKQCRNMVGVSFDAMAPAGTDMRVAWRERLAAEGKLVDGSETVRELVLGAGAPIEAAGPLGTASGR